MLLFLFFLENWYEIFSQSLEPRPRSIYDVLDHSAANIKPDQSTDKPKKKKKPSNMVSMNFKCFVTFFLLAVENTNVGDPSSSSSTDGANHTTPGWRRIWICLWELLNQKCTYLFISVAEIISVCFTTCYHWLKKYLDSLNVKAPKAQCKNTQLHVNARKTQKHCQ